MKKFFLLITLIGAVLLSGCMHKQKATVNCPDTLVDERDGQKYETVKIGDQCWMKETLKIGKVKSMHTTNTTHVSEDSTLPKDDDIIEKYCGASSLEKCKDTLGFYYTRDEAMDHNTQEGTQGICPKGRHIPTEKEWKIVENQIKKWQKETPEIRLIDHLNSPSAYNWERTSSSSSVKIEKQNYHSVRAHRIMGDGESERFGSTVRENKYYVRCLKDS